MSHIVDHCASTVLASSRVELASGVDGFYLSGHGFAPPWLYEDLEERKQAAIEADLPTAYRLGGYPVKVLPRAFGKYKYAVSHDLALIGITPSERIPRMRFQFSAIALHALGPSTAALWAANVLDACGVEDARLTVNRLDLHADWQGIEFKANERAHFVTYSDLRSLYEVGEAMSGLSFGKRGAKLYCRIYDKAREMKAKGHDWWPELWGARYDDERPVIRVEFEFRREGLVEFGVDTPHDAVTRAGELWAYASQKWISLRQPTADDTRARWPIDDRWRLIQGSSLAHKSLPAERIRAGEREGTLRTYRKLATGVLTSMAVPMGTGRLDDTLAAAGDELELYERISGRTFADRVSEKRQRSTP